MQLTRYSNYRKYFANLTLARNFILGIGVFTANIGVYGWYAWKLANT